MHSAAFLSYSSATERTEYPRIGLCGKQISIAPRAIETSAQITMLRAKLCLSVIYFFYENCAFEIINHQSSINFIKKNDIP